MLRKDFLAKKARASPAVDHSEVLFVVGTTRVETAGKIRGVSKALFQNKYLFAGHLRGFKLLLNRHRGIPWISPAHGASCQSPFLDWMVHPHFVGYKSALVAARLAYKLGVAQNNYAVGEPSMHKKLFIKARVAMRNYLDGVSRCTLVQTTRGTSSCIVDSLGIRSSG